MGNRELISTSLANSVRAFLSLSLRFLVLHQLALCIAFDGDFIK